MFPKVWIANLVLAVLVVFFSVNAYKIWYEDADAGKEERIVKTTAQKAVAGRGEKYVKRLMPAESAYDIVADHNLFSPDREEYVPDEPEPAAAPEPLASKDRISGETITLYGIIILNDYKKALINNPKRQTGESEQIWVTIGDAVSNLKVADIQKESIVLAEGKKKYEVLLYDKSKVKSRNVPVSSPSKSAEAPTVITNEPAKKKTAPPPKRAIEKNVNPNVNPNDKRMMDNPFRRKFPKQNQ